MLPNITFVLVCPGNKLDSEPISAFKKKIVYLKALY